VSKPEGNGIQPEREALTALEAAVGQALERLDVATSRAEEAEATSTELEEIVRRFTGDEAEAGRLLTRLKDLATANTDLEGRLAKGREGVDRLLAKIRFLEEQK